LTPSPPHRAHVAATVNRTGRVTPRAASASSISTSPTMSAPRARRGRVADPNSSSPKNAEKRSDSVLKSNWLGWKPPLRSPAWP
jgi:hypothetical protein